MCVFTIILSSNSPESMEGKSLGVTSYCQRDRGGEGGLKTQEIRLWISDYSGVKTVDLGSQPDLGLNPTSSHSMLYDLGRVA